MNRKSLIIGLVLSLVIILSSITGVAAKKPTVDPTVTTLVSGLGSTSGSTVGHDGALYVAERGGQEGRILRVDPQTGDWTVFASGLPQAQIPPGGVVDVAFIGNTLYALVTVVNDPLFGGGSDAAGIYRMDSPSSFTLIADIGDFSMNHVPTNTQIDLVGNVVPTGLEVRGNRVYMAEAGTVENLHEDSKVVVFGPKSPPGSESEVASGAPLLVDVEFGRGRTLFALSQGTWSGSGAGEPADEDTGSFLKVNRDGTFTELADELDRPTSLEVIGNTAYVVTLDGEILKIDGVSGPPYGESRGKHW
jgi:hypothetical protein